MHHIYELAGTKQKLTQRLNGDKSNICQCSTSNGFVGLYQANKYGVKATDTMDFINKKTP